MKRTRLPSVLTAFVLAAGLGSPSAPAQTTHEDNIWGFKIRVPRGWRKIPLQAEERWIVAKYQSKRYYLSEESYQHKPEMKIMVFPAALKKEKGRQVEEVGRDGETVKVKVKQRYRTYKEYLKGNYTTGGGYYFTREDEDEIAGIRVSQYEIKVEKLSYIGNKRIIAWVYHLPDADVAVDIDVLENRYRKLRSTVYGVLRSFKLAERTGPPPSQTGNARAKGSEKKKPREKMTPIERMKERKKKAEKAIQAAVAALPKGAGWKVKKSPHFTVLTHVDAKFTRRIINQAEAIRGWLDKTLYEIGDEYVPECIIRICLDNDERSAYTRGSADATSWDSREIVLAKRDVWDPRWEMETLSTGICLHWFQTKNDNLFDDLPPWISRGIQQYVGTALCKGKKLTFKADDWETRYLREGKRKGKLVKCKDLILMTGEQYNKQYNKSGQVLLSQAGSVFRYLMSPRCRRGKLTRKVVMNYFKNLNDVVAEVKKKEKEAKKKKSKSAETEEEEEQQRKQRIEAAKKRARYVVDETFKRTFGHWTARDWAAFERGWRKASL